MNTAIRLLSALFAIGCVYATIMQFNDSDRWLWIGTYVVAGLLAAFAAFGRPRKVPSAVLGVVLLVWAGWLASQVFVGAKPSAPSVSEESGLAASQPAAGTVTAGDWWSPLLDDEEAREMFGLMIAGVWMLVIAGAMTNRSSSGQRSH
jgi:hypothetical protein